ncbi:MAG: helix-turn-helix domain-containing protein [Salinarimonas sp.]
MTPELDWPALVEEAVRRRRQEGLTQRDLAALAGVSAPTVVAFEKGQTSLRLDSALAILRVVGLAAAAGAADPQDVFLRESRRRWERLVEHLPPGAAARQPHGSSEFNYALDLPAHGSIARFAEAMEAASSVRYTGWPPFWFSARSDLRPEIVDGTLECWLGRPDAKRVFEDAAHTDFWRARPDARLYLRRGYQEDGPDLPMPGTVLDWVLPVWRAGEVALHAATLARRLAPSDSGEIAVGLGATFSGLSGREMVSWANPLRPMPSGGRHRARVDRAICRATARVNELETDLATVVGRWLEPLYARFDLSLPPDLIRGELDEMRTRKRTA